jgi:hypothetical protein
MQPPPQSIEINIAKEAPMQQTMFTGTPQLTGQLQPGVGIPLGMVMEKPPFSWKQFFIGAGIPTLLILAPLLLAISSEPSYDYNGVTEVITLSQEQGTNYSGSLLAPEGMIIDYCWVTIPTNSDQYYSCEERGDSITIWIDYWGGDEYQRDKVGNYSSKTGIMEFDDGNDHGESVYVSISFIEPYEETPSEDLHYLASDITGAMCFIAPITALVLLIVGFSTAKKALGIGGIVGLVLYPFLAIFALIVTW